jgi:hypothetical protein
MFLISLSLSPSLCLTSLTCIPFPLPVIVHSGLEPTIFLFMFPGNSFVMLWQQEDGETYIIDYIMRVITSIRVR